MPQARQNHAGLGLVTRGQTGLCGAFCFGSMPNIGQEARQSVKGQVYRIITNCRFYNIVNEDRAGLMGGRQFGAAGDQTVPVSTTGRVA